MSGLLPSLLATVALAYGAVLALVYFGQERLVYFPGVGRDDRTTPADLRLAYEDVWLDTADGERLHAWLVPHARPRGVVILFHGNAGSIAQRLDYVAMFQRLGLSTLIVDYRGYGRSSGRPTEEGLALDAEAAWQYIVAERGVLADRIVLFGESLGGAVAARLAAHQRPAALVLASTFTSVPELAADLYPWLPARWLSRIRHDTRTALARVTCPVLVAHSPEDDIVPFSHGRRLFETAPGRRSFLELAGGHNQGFIFVRPDWVAGLARFLDTHLAD